MNKKIFSVIITLVLCITSFAACTDSDDEQQTIDSNETSAVSEQITSTVADAEELLSEVNEAKSAGTLSAFENVLTNSTAAVASYNGPDDIIIDYDVHINKTVAVKTVGRIEINSTLDCLVVNDAPGGLVVNAAVGSILIDGSSVTADICSDTGEIYIKGTAAKVNIRGGVTNNIIVRNTTAVIYNHSDNAVTVTLVNGAKRTVEKNHTYQVREDLISKGITES